MTTMSDVPPTEPTLPPADAEKPATGRRKSAAAAPSKRTRTSGADLRPDLAKHKAAVETAYWYWIGALPSLPVEHCFLAGEAFPKVEEKVLRGDREVKRVPVIGAVVRLNERKWRLLRDKLSRTVVRFTEPVKVDENGSGRAVDVMLSEEATKMRRKGFLITIPTGEEMEARRKAGLPLRPYVQQPGDEPAARYLFAQLCENQERPTRGEFYPEPLEVTGLEWPGDLQD